MKPETKKALIVVGVVALFTVPVFRSGGRTGLTFAGWIINHTVFGPPVEYVPFEQYSEEMQGVSCPQTQQES